VPCRALDTRKAAGAFSGILSVDVAASSCAPAGAQGYVVNTTVVPPSPLGYLQLWPYGQPQPAAATVLNALDGAITNNMAIVQDASGWVDAYATNSTQLLLDIFGYFAPVGGAAPPVVTSIYPASGAPGTPVTITGTGFGTTQGTVAFDGVPAAVVSWSATSIVAEVPVGATAGFVTVDASGFAPVASATSFTPPPAPALTVTSAHTGSFTQGQTGVAYTLTVTNAGAASTNGTAVTVIDTVPVGLIPMSIAGSGWTCAQPAGPCTRTDVLAAGASYAPITLTANVSPTAPSGATNQVSVSGGGSAGASGGDPTIVVALPTYANPLAFAVPVSVVGGVPATFSVTYTAQNGPADIASGQVVIDGCYFAWDSSGNVLLYSVSSGYSNATGVLGQASPIWAGNCTINLQSSSLSRPVGNPHALVLTLNIAFPNQTFPGSLSSTTSGSFVGPHEVYAWGTTNEGLNTGQVDLGSMVVSQGQDFTLNLAPTGQVTVPAGAYSVLDLALTAQPVGGFSGSISLSYQLQAMNETCMALIGAPGTIAANGQATVAVQISNCPAGAAANLWVLGSAIGISRSPADNPTMVYAFPTGNFTVAVGVPSPVTLTPQGQVTFPVTVSSVGGFAGTLTLSLSGAPPTGVSYYFSPAQVTLYGGGTATSYLTFTGSTAMPGGSFALGVTATASLQANSAAFTLSTQVTTFQVTSVTGSGIVQNTGQEVQITQSVPANNAPEYTTCSSADPNVTCQVISSAPGTVTLGVTASTSAVHGTRVLSLNGGAGASHLAIADFGGAGGLSIDPSSIQAGTSTPPPGAQISGPMLDPYCDDDGDCAGPSLYIEPVTGAGGLGGYIASLTPATIYAILYASPNSAGDYNIFVDMCGGYWDPDAENWLCQFGPAAFTVTPAAGQQPTVSSISPNSVLVGASNVSITISGSGFGSSPTVNLPQGFTNGGQTPSADGTSIAVVVSVGTNVQRGANSITVTTGAGTSNPGTITVNPVVAMALKLVGTVISTDGNYSEDSTIQVTAVDANSHAPITTFTGTVSVAEDGTAIYSQNTGSGGCLVYFQNACVAASSITISTGGTATFLARSVAGPKTTGQNGAPPDPASIKTTNYPVDGGASLVVPQWIVSGNLIDPFATGPVYDWFQSRTKDIRERATGNLATVLAAVSGYSLNGILTGGGRSMGSWGSLTSVVEFNPFFVTFRLDSAVISYCGLPGAPHALANALYHEARHAYQFSLMNATNDNDHDYLVNSIPVAPSNISVDTTASRTVCDEVKNLTSQMSFLGPNIADSYGSVANSVPGVGFAIEMDAHTFASQYQ
jgi:hypothetical protein